MKKSEAQLIISAVGRAIRKLLDPMRGEVTALTEKLAQAEQTIATQREMIAKLDKDQTDQANRFAERSEVLEEIVREMQKNMPRMPSIEEIVAHIKVLPPPTLEEISAHVMEQVPTPEQIKAYIADAVPKPEDVAKLVTIEVPSVPTAEEIAKLVVVTVPTVEEIAKLVPVPIVPTVEEIAKAVPIPIVPSEQDIAAHVRQQFELRETPTLQQVKQLVTDAIPTAEDVAKLVPVPEIPTIELPELPEIPTLDEIVASVKEILPSLIPAPLKGDAGKSITIDDVRPIIEEMIKALPKPQDGKSLTIDDVRPLFSQWVIEFERLAAERHDKVLALMPRPKDGKDGKGFDHLRNVQSEQIGDRVIRLFVMEGEERVDLCEFKFHHPLHKGVFTEGREYDRGDQVTHGGCAWIALKETPQGTPGSSDDWQLAVKKGRDGKDAVIKDSPPTQVRVAPRRGS